MKNPMQQTAIDETDCRLWKTRRARWNLTCTLDWSCRPFIDSHRWRQRALNLYEIDAKFYAVSEFQEIEKKYQCCSKLWIFFFFDDGKLERTIPSNVDDVIRQKTNMNWMQNFTLNPNLNKTKKKINATQSYEFFCSLNTVMSNAIRSEIDDVSRHSTYM